MATVKAILYKSKKKSDGKYSIAIRVTKDRKSKYFFLEWIDEKYWDVKNFRVKSAHPNSRRLNNLIAKKVAEADDTILEYEASKKHYAINDIINVLKGEKITLSFFDLAEEHILQLKKMNKANRAVSDNSKINTFREFINKDELLFDEITEQLLNKFKAYLVAKGSVSERSIMNIFILIRLLYNRAIKMGIADRQRYPFGESKIRISLPESIKIGLDEDEIRRMESLELENGSPILHTRNVFLFSFYLAGIRISDVLKMKWNDIKDDRLYYRMGKNNKITSLKIPKAIFEILEYYKSEKIKGSDYIFPELKKADENNPEDIYIKTKTAIKKFNKYLGTLAKMAEIDKKVTTHIARHSFGNIAGDKISPHMLQKLYRHSNLSTTIGYQANFIHKDADDALDSVLNF
ncbi:site-specific integrase [Aquimarina agarilytica]|uniref:site-specific integrase n=1 Tax=Aquimarina agarilytica TaxID=1087449 RepID=UPI00028A17D8|nr:site-specific integrase [Aquimarina agarilytica]